MYDLDFESRVFICLSEICDLGNVKIGYTPRSTIITIITNLVPMGQYEEVSNLNFKVIRQDHVIYSNTLNSQPLIITLKTTLLNVSGLHGSPKH